MLKIRTFFCMILAFGSGYFLYTKKHETMVINNKIRVAVREIGQTKERTARLRERWILENKPDRLESLTRYFLPYLRSAKPDQYVSLKELKYRLPPIRKNGQ